MNYLIRSPFPLFSWVLVFCSSLFKVSSLHVRKLVFVVCHKYCLLVFQFWCIDCKNILCSPSYQSSFTVYRFWGFSYRIKGEFTCFLTVPNGFTVTFRSLMHTELILCVVWNMESNLFSKWLTRLSKLPLLKSPSLPFSICQISIWTLVCWVFLVHWSIYIPVLNHNWLYSKF